MATETPMAEKDTPKDSAYNGMVGMIAPKPS
jgi:hypothetical protein